MSSFIHIQNDSTLLPLCFEKDVYDGAKVHAFLHLNCIITTQKEVVSFDNYQADSGYFPIMWKEELNPYKDLSRKIESCPPYAELKTYSKRTGKDIEYVLLWGDYGRYNDNPETKLMFRQLMEDYNLIYRIQGKQLLEVYKRK